MGDSEGQYEFSSHPTVPREKTADILVKFQAVSSTNPCLLSKSYKLSSKTTVYEVRKQIQSEFEKVFDNGFVFLCKNKEILTSRERVLTLRQILPKAGLGKPANNKIFQYDPDVSYKKIGFDKEGRGYRVTCVGLLFLCESSGVSHWSGKSLSQQLDAHGNFGFTFIPSDITSARSNESQIEELNHYAAMSRLESVADSKGKETEDSEEAEQKSKIEIYIEKIETLLKTSHLNEEKMKDRYLATPLHHVAGGASLKMCQFLCQRLDRGKLMYEKDMYGRTPLHWALERNGLKSKKKHLRIAAYLLTFVADSTALNEKDVNGLSCLNMILALPKEDTITLMKDLDPDLINPTLVLHLCCCALQYRELSEALRYCQSVPYVQPTFIRPPLHLAAEFGNEDIVKALLTSFYKASDVDPDGNLPFHYACQHGKVELIKHLYYEHMSQENRAKGVKTALYWKKFDVIGEIAKLENEILYPINIDPDLLNLLVVVAEKNMRTHGVHILKLMMVVSTMQEYRVKILSPFVNQAAFFGLTGVLEGLLWICPSDYRDVMFRSPLHEAVQGVHQDKKSKNNKKQNRFETFKILLEYQVETDIVDWRGSTPLHYACMTGDMDLIKLMLSRKDIDMSKRQDSVGRTPLLVTAHNLRGHAKRYNALEFMIRHHLEDLDPYAQDAYGKNILHYLGSMKPDLVDHLFGKLKYMEDTSEPYIMEKSWYPEARLKHHPPRRESKLQDFITFTPDKEDLCCRYCNIILTDTDYYTKGFHFCMFKLENVPGNGNISAAETLVVMDKPNVLKKLLKAIPDVCRGDVGLAATCLAVKLWRQDCAEILINAVDKKLKYIDYYLLAALERTPTEKWNNGREKCRLGELKTKADRKESEMQAQMVLYLLKLGANPNYIPDQSGYEDRVENRTFIKENMHGSYTDPPRLNSDIPGPLRQFCTALERAIIMGNHYLIDLILEQPKTRVVGTFAVHLAAKAGNVQLFESLLKRLKKELKSGYGDDSQNDFVSTLPNGILGAACVSDKATLELFEVVNEVAPEILKGTKLLTRKLLAGTRPVMLEILKIHNNLPLVLFIRKRHQHISPKTKERIACFILQNGAYPAEMRLTKTTFIHPVCEYLMAAQRHHMFKVIAILLNKSGVAWWKCVFDGCVEKNVCQSRLYSTPIRDWGDHWHWSRHTRMYEDTDRFPDILRYFSQIPIEVASMFTKTGLKALTTLDRSAKEEILQADKNWAVLNNEDKEEDLSNVDKDDPTDILVNAFLRIMISRLWLRPTRELLSSTKKNTTSKNNASKKWTPLHVDCETTTLAQLETVKDFFHDICPNISLPILEHIIHIRSVAMFSEDQAKYLLLEKRCLSMLRSSLSHQIDIPAINHAVALGDVYLVKYIIDRNNVSVLTQDNGKNLLDLAARKADLPMLTLLVENEFEPTEDTLMYAALDLRYWKEKTKHGDVCPHFKDPGGEKRFKSSTTEEAMRLELVKYIFERFVNPDQASLPKYTEVLQKTAKYRLWKTASYLLDMGVPVYHEDDLGDDDEWFGTWGDIGLLMERAPASFSLKVIKSNKDELFSHKMRLGTFLYYAARCDQRVTVALLLEDIRFSSRSHLTQKDIFYALTTLYRGTIGTFCQLCQNGDVANVKLILRAMEGIEVLNTLNHSTSPLCYALINQHWNLAELLLLNGANPDGLRTVPGICMKRTGYPQPEKVTRVTMTRQFPTNRSDSSGVATAFESKSDIFHKPKKLLKLKKNPEHIAHLPCLPPRQVTKSEDQRRLKRLLDIARVGKFLGGNIFHGAWVEGDIDLMKEIRSQPRFYHMMEESNDASPSELPLTNKTVAIVADIMKDEETIKDIIEMKCTSDEDNLKLTLIRPLCEKFWKSEVGAEDMYLDVLRKAVDKKLWGVVEYMIDVGVPVLVLTTEGKEYLPAALFALVEASNCTTEIITKAPAFLALKAVKSLQESTWTKQTLRIILDAAVKTNQTDVTRYILEEVMFGRRILKLKPKEIFEVLFFPLPIRAGCTGLLHMLCKNGDIDNVKLILKGIPADNTGFLKVFQQSTTPLWYSLAFKHWELAELFLLNGASPHCFRAVPDIYMKKTGYKFTEKPVRITVRRQFLDKANASVDVATDLMSSNKIFLKREAPKQLKQNPDKDQHSIRFNEERRSKSSGQIRVEMLMELALVGKSLGGNIYHAAVLEGDVNLMKEVQAQPLFTQMMNMCEVSPLVLALSNLKVGIVSEVTRVGDSPKDNVEMIKMISKAVIYSSQSTPSSIFKLKRLLKLDQANDSETADTKIVKKLHNSLLSNYKAGWNLKANSSSDQHSLEVAAAKMMDILSTQNIPDEFLIALAVLGMPILFEMLKDKVRSNSLLTSRMIENFTLTDMLIIIHGFTDQRRLYNVLEILSNVGTLHISDEVISFSVRGGFTRVLRIVAESISKKEANELKFDKWKEVFLLAAAKGDVPLTTMMLKIFSQDVENTHADIMDKGFLLSSSKGQTDVVSKISTVMLQKKILKFSKLQEATERAITHDRLVVVRYLLEMCLEYEQFDINIAKKIMTLTGVPGSKTLFQTVFDFAKERFQVDQTNITREVATVLIQGAKNGHEEFCLYLLENFPDVDLKKTTHKRNATALHFACERGLGNLVSKIVEKDKTLLEIEDRDKRTALQNAKDMGHIHILNKVYKEYGIVVANSTNLQFCGSLRFHLAKNTAESVDKKDEDRTSPPIGTSKRRMWTLDNAFEYGDEEAALAMCYSSDGDTLSTLIHKASKYGFLKVLLVIFEHFEDKKDKLEKILTSEMKGATPIALAVQFKRGECVKLLKETHDPSSWISSTYLQETIFHVAARTGDVTILEMLLDNADPQSVNKKDGNGMSPVVYSIALGHHKLCSLFFKQGYPSDPNHVSHTQSDPTCHECLLDRCFGWSKMCLDETKMQPQTSTRDVWERATRVGFTSDAKSKTHVIERLVEYTDMSKDNSIVEQAMQCMGFDATIDAARVFLFQTAQIDQLLKVRLCISRGWDSTAVILLKHIGQRKGEAFYGTVLDLAIAANSKEIVQYIITYHQGLMNKKLVDFTALETALCLQRYDILDTIGPTTDQIDFNSLSDFKNCIPLAAQWISGISYPGNESWLDSIGTRLPEANCVMLKSSDIKLMKKLETTSITNTMLPSSLEGITLTVDVESFKTHKPVPSSDWWLMSVISRYLHILKSIIEEASQTEELKSIEVSCLPPGEDTPLLQIVDGKVIDRVRLEMSEATNNHEPTMFVNGFGRLPVELKSSSFKKQIEDWVIPEASKLAASVIGHGVDVRVDWTSFDKDISEETKAAMFEMMSGRDRHSALGGLMDVLQQCENVCSDIAVLLSEDMVKSVQKILTPVQTITVELTNTIPRWNRTLFSAVDHSLTWYVSVKDGELTNLPSGFPLYSLITACHSVCVKIWTQLVELEPSEMKDQPQSKKPASIFPETIDGVSFIVDIDSFRKNNPVPSSDPWLIAAIADYLPTLKSVLQSRPDRYREYREIEPDKIESVEISCLASSSVQPNMTFNEGKLMDMVILDKIETGGQRDAVMCVQGSERLPPPLHRDSICRDLIEEYSITEFVMGQVFGHEVTVKVDWTSINTIVDERERSTVYEILSGRDLHGLLGGLDDTIKACEEKCADIAALAGEIMLQSVQELLSPVKEIVVKLTDSIPKSKVYFSQTDHSITWWVRYKDGKLFYSPSVFPLYAVVNACHSVSVSLSPGLAEFADVTKIWQGDSSGLSRKESLKRERIQRSLLHSGHFKKKDGAFAEIEWRTFGSIGDVRALCQFGRNGAGLEMMRFAAGLKHLLLYKCKAKSVKVKGTDVVSKAGLSFEDDCVTLTLHPTRSHNAGWVSSGFDVYMRLQEIENKWVVENIKIPKSMAYVGEQASAEALKRFGIPLSFALTENAWIQHMLQRENQNVFGEHDDFKYLMQDYEGSFQNTMIDGIEAALLSTQGIWQFDKIDKPGLWFWVSHAELQNGISFDTFLVGMKKDGDLVYQIMTMEAARRLEPKKVHGVWYHQSMDKTRTTKSIQRLQMISFSGWLFHVTDPYILHEVLLRIPSQVKLGFCQRAEKDDESIFYMSTVAWGDRFQMRKHLLSSINKPYIDSKAIHDCWFSCLHLGVNVVIDVADFRQFGVGSIVIEQTANGTKRSIEKFIEQKDLLTQSLCSSDLSSMGLLVVGVTDVLGNNTERPWVAGGKSKDDEHYIIYPMSDNDLYVGYEQVLTQLKRSGDSSSICSDYTRVLNLAFGHIRVENAKAVLTKTIQGISGTGSSELIVEFLHPTPDDMFIPQTELVLDNVVKSCTFATSVSHKAKTFMKTEMTAIHIKKTGKSSDIRKTAKCPDIVNIKDGILTIYAVRKSNPVSLKTITEWILKTFNVDIASLSGDVRYDAFIRFAPVGYGALCPKKGINTFVLGMTDILGREISDDRKQRIKTTKLRVHLKEDNSTEKTIIPDPIDVKEGEGFQITYDSSLSDQSNKQAQSDLGTVTMLFGDQMVFGPVSCFTGYQEIEEILKGKKSNQILLKKSTNPAFNMLPRHEHVCWGAASKPSKSNDPTDVPGNCIVKVQMQAVIFEIFYNAEFRTNKEADGDWFKILTAKQTPKATRENLLYVFKFIKPRKRIFIQVRCKTCMALMDLHTKVLSVPSGQYLEVLHNL